MACRCERCDRTFATQKAQQQHVNDSPHHHLCAKCNKDCTSWKKLVSHVINKHSAQFCKSCDAFWWTLAGYDSHLKGKEVCSDCNKHFDDKNGLLMHMTSHLPKKIECFSYGCTKKFKMYGHMINHIHSSKRCSGWSIEAVSLSAIRSLGYLPEFGNGKDFIDYFMLSDAGADTDHLRPFCCLSETCNRTFSSLGALFQHVESPHCRASLKGDTMSTLIAKMRMFNKGFVEID